MTIDPLFHTALADEVRSFICDEGPGDHGHTDCWHLSMAADIIDARIDYDARTPDADA